MSGDTCAATAASCSATQGRLPASSPRPLSSCARRGCRWSTSARAHAHEPSGTTTTVFRESLASTLMLLPSAGASASATDKLGALWGQSGEVSYTVLSLAPLSPGCADGSAAAGLRRGKRRTVRLAACPRSSSSSLVSCAELPSTSSSADRPAASSASRYGTATRVDEVERRNSVGWESSTKCSASAAPGARADSPSTRHRCRNAAQKHSPAGVQQYRHHPELRASAQAADTVAAAASSSASPVGSPRWILAASLVDSTNRSSTVCRYELGRSGPSRWEAGLGAALSSVEVAGLAATNRVRRARPRWNAPSRSTTSTSSPTFTSSPSKSAASSCQLTRHSADGPGHHGSCLSLPSAPSATLASPQGCRPSAAAAASPR
mmetsp:Transcript_46274/g.117146  ORF Transcript_46274/g.117146 Transcript_46274/m.117146 type:complete len:378 (+) Transcript_46274:784-1917(+)